MNLRGNWADIIMSNVTASEILGTVCTGKGDSSAHVEKNISKCRRSYFNLVQVGFVLSWFKFLFQSSPVAYCMCALLHIEWKVYSSVRKI
jgi:hypothetical protein